MTIVEFFVELFIFKMTILRFINDSVSWPVIVPCLDSAELADAAGDEGLDGGDCVHRVVPPELRLPLGPAQYFFPHQV